MKYLFPLLLLIFCSCQNKNTLSSIPQLSLPLQNECAKGLEETCDIMNIEGNGGESVTNSQCYLLVGKFPSPNSNVYLLFRRNDADDFMPYVCVYDSNMMLLQKVTPVIHGCIDDEFVVVKENYVINEDLSIVTTEIDTYGNWNDDNKFVEDSAFITIQHMVLDDKGFFEVKSIEEKRIEE